MLGNYLTNYCAIVPLITVLIQPDKQRVIKRVEALLPRSGRYGFWFGCFRLQKYILCFIL